MICILLLRPRLALIRVKKRLEIQCTNRQTHIVKLICRSSAKFDSAGIRVSTRGAGGDSAPLERITSYLGEKDFLKGMPF